MGLSRGVFSGTYARLLPNFLVEWPEFGVASWLKLIVLSNNGTLNASDVTLGSIESQKKI